MYAGANMGHPYRAVIDAAWNCFGARGGCRDEAPTCRSTHRLEQELQRELNGPGTIQLVIRNSESRVIGFTASGIRCGKLDPIKRVEHLRSELQTEPFPRSEVHRFECREIPLIDPLAPKPSIHARPV